MHKLPNNIKSIATIHRDSDGIEPYMKCPWCDYADVISGFEEYHHLNEDESKETVSTSCRQCGASGLTIVFILAYYGKDVDLLDMEKDKDYGLYILKLIAIHL